VPFSKMTYPPVNHKSVENIGSIGSYQQIYCTDSILLVFVLSKQPSFPNFESIEDMIC
jgi:hypothetical protein